MARQMGIIKVAGTIANVTFYKMGGKLYARSKSSLSKKKVKNDPAFRNSRAAAAIFAVASRIGSLVYAEVAPKKKKLKLYRKITGDAMRLLKAGMDKEEVMRIVRREVGVGE